ncbi:hypothetical protein PTTG_26086 [Puccinia triticina 1-1 BBBD Race 1]|uniref:CCHC-type domain-containing protein n=1 Tax=Puccinia triticina (isolate 1-1 / race 1 (BBBD)) TaxID=630390 RepID=A0A180GXY2_PUCT1|nr:hypothetical protein PTTG_26086 [Puccinia triticina 1-1 BBBD Race 1]
MGWEASTLISQYHQGPHKDVRLALVLARAHFMELSDLTNLALKIDNKINGTDATTIDQAPTVNPKAMDLSAAQGYLSGTEKAHMMKEGMCFCCGEKGHIARDCPDKPKKKKGKDAIRIAELEEQVRRLTLDPGNQAEAGRAEQSKNGNARV